MTAAVLDRVTKRFGRVTVLDEVSFRVGEGEVVAVLGPNGAGKSTALAVLLGLRSAERGEASEQDETLPGTAALRLVVPDVEAERFGQIVRRGRVAGGFGAHGVHVGPGGVPGLGVYRVLSGGATMPDTRTSS